MQPYRLSFLRVNPADQLPRHQEVASTKMLSVLVVNWNTRELLGKCLHSLLDDPLHIEQEIIVIDNASSDESSKFIEQNFPTVKLITAESNYGYADGNNLAFSLAKGDWILTLNPDTEVPPRTLAAAVKTLAAHPNCACLSVRFIGPDGNVQPSIRGFPSILGVLGQLAKLDRLFPDSPLASYSLPRFDYDKPQHAPQPMGTFLLFRRHALLQIDQPGLAFTRSQIPRYTTEPPGPLAPFDPQFPIFFNEVDLLYRLHQAGYNTWYEATLHILHHHGASTKKVKKSMIWESHLSLVRYFQKHLAGPRRLLLPLLAVASVIGAFLRAKGYHAGFRAQRHHM